MTKIIDLSFNLKQNAYILGSLQAHFYFYFYFFMFGYQLLHA